MREIKFRAWDGEKMMFFDLEHGLDCGFIYSGDNSMYIEDGAIVMQYTGLKDKNDKEIYEGDILNVCNGSINGKACMQSPYEVKYIPNKGFDICMFCWDSKGENDMDSTHWCEIIGNIHENTELLKN